MNVLDYTVLFGAVLAIVMYGVLRTRDRRNLHDYLRGKKHSWFLIGLSVMATQASAVTFLSTPGQGYSGGLAFVQNYFAMPLALVIIAAFFLPIYRRFNVYTAYEYLSNRFDKKTRLLAVCLFLLQRALFAGITIYAPAIVLSTVFGWSLPLTITASGVFAIIYTVAGGSDAVTHTQKYQIAVIFIGMITAFVILVSKIPASFGEALTVAGHFGKTNAVSFNPDLRERYTVWTGMLGGLFLMLSYFGTDQSQVQRYISGDNLRGARVGLMFNALFKIPMQFGILLLGVMLFIFYQFHVTPIQFNSTELNKHLKSTATVQVLVEEAGDTPVLVDPKKVPKETPTTRRAMPEQEILALYSSQFEEQEKLTKGAIADGLAKRRSGESAQAEAAFREARKHYEGASAIRDHALSVIKQTNPRLPNDADYVFISFILANLPHGLIGLLVACFFFATLSAKAAELNALGSCTTVDLYRYIIRPPHAPATALEPAATDSSAPLSYAGPSVGEASGPSEHHYVLASKFFTIFWGVVAIAMALTFLLAENLIQASNIVGSLFSGVILGIFMIAFFVKFIRGTAAFAGAILAQILVFAMYSSLNISYLWYNLIGCAAAVLIALIIQLALGQPKQPAGFPVDMNSPPPKPPL